MKKILLSLLFSAGIAAASFAQPVADFSGNPTTLCAGGNVTWTNLTTNLGNNTSWAWSFPGGVNSTSVSQNPGPRNYSVPGVYGVTLIVTSSNGIDTMYKPNYITVLASPTITVTPNPGYICSLGSVTLNANGGIAYSWAPATGLNTTTGAIVIASPTVTTNYNVIGVNSGGCTSTTQTSVSVNNAPPAPAGTISGPTTVCAGQTGVIFTVPGVTPPVPVRTWTVPAGSIITAGQGTRSVTVTFGSTSGNVCCTTSNACGAATPTCIGVTVDPTPVVGAIGTITGPTSVCDNQTGIVYTIPAVANALTYNWTENSDATITGGQGTNTITVTFGTNNNTNICVTASNSCNTSTQSCLAVISSPNAPGVPGAITGPTTVCSGAAGVNYSVGFVNNATSYNWSVPAGASITAGQGTRTITVTYGATSGTVCVTADNGCGTSAASCTAVTVDPAPAVGTIGTITGPTAVCANQTGINYIIPAVTNATTYNWTVPGTATITAGQGTNTITVTFGGTGGNICVDAGNTCSSTSQVCLSITVSPNAPAIPGGITGPVTVCNGQTGVNYSIASVPNASVYTWTVPAGATITGGQGGTNITVSFGVSSGTICVTAGNACGTSIGSCQVITVDPTPAVGTVGTITGPTAICANQTGVNYSVAAVTGASTYNWTVPAGASITGGQGTNSITVTFGTNGGNICVDASNSCSSTAPSCQNISVVPSAPAIPGGINGPTTVCNGEAGVVYSVASVPNTAVYTWTVPAGATIVTGQGTRFLTVDFGASSGTICVTAGNACGTSLASCTAISVDPLGAVGPIGTISGPSAVCANQTGVTYIMPAVTNASNYNWTVPGTATITAGQGTNTITVTFGNNGGNVCVTANNSCSNTSQDCQAVAVSATAPAIPGAITGPTTVCNGQTGVNYTVGTVPNTTVYTWTAPSGATIASGQGTRTVTINFGATSGTVCVTAGNACGTSLGSCQAITVDPTPAVGTVGTITGITAACANQTNVTYSIANVANATSYNWTVPAGASITAGQGTTTITVTYGNVSGNICVDASNSCGTSLPGCLTVTVSPSAPAIPTGIIGATTVCSGQAGVTYSIAPVANALSYTWTVPAGATITAGQGSTMITVTFGSTSGNVCATAGNGCGTSLASCTAISVNASVLNVGTSASPATCSTCCDGSSTAVPSGGTAPYSYAWNSTPGQTTATATGLCASTGYTVCVTDAMGCVTCKAVTIPFTTGVSSLTDNGTIKVFPNPANNEIFIEGILSSSANMQVNILNIYGQKMMDKTFYTNGSFTEKMSIESLSPGVYLIEIRSGEMKRDMKIVKIQ